MPDIVYCLTRANAQKERFLVAFNEERHATLMRIARQEGLSHKSDFESRLEALQQMRGERLSDWEQVD